MSTPGPSRTPSPQQASTRADVTVTLECNNACRFCPRPTLRHLHVDTAKGLEQRLAALRRESTQITLSGGEVTVLPDLTALVSRCRALGFEQIGIITNGRRLADADLARGLVEAGLTGACVTVYDLRPAVHDALTGRPGSLVESLRGLDNLLALAREVPALQVRINTLLCVDNADGLVALLRELADRGVNRMLVGDMLLSERYPTGLVPQRIVALAREVAADPLLAKVAVELRGFPPCLLRGVHGVEVQPHEVDTVMLEQADRDAYFAQFNQSFEHVEACAGCALLARCPGVQKRAVEQHGSAHVVPITALPHEERRVVDRGELEQARRELARFPPRTPCSRLEVNTTTACPFRCVYCCVELGERHAPTEVMDRAVDLLLSSEHERLELQFFGGEPLLRRREVERTLRRGTERAQELGKQLRFVLTTCGLLLKPEVLAVLRQYDVEVLYSLDGPADVMSRYRPLARSGADVTPVLEENLRRLLDSGIDCFVNLVVTPDGADDLPRRLEHVLGLGARDIQICYALAPGWTDAAQQAYCEGLRWCAERMSAPELRLQNLGATEPVLLSLDMIVDVDGTVYHDIALFCERLLPGLRDAFRLGHVDRLTEFDTLQRSPEEGLVLLRNAYPDSDSEPRRIVEQQLAMAWKIQQVQSALAAEYAPSSHGEKQASGPDGEPLSSRIRAPRVVDRNPLQERVLRRSLAHQARFIQRRPELLSLPLLMLENPCQHDCLFCMAKPLAPTPLPDVRRWLSENRARSLNLTRLGIAGNEPLAHPDIDAILAAARDAGFEQLEVLTSGAPLADPDRARALFDMGARAFGIPLYAADAAIHDAITQAPGSHGDTVRAIENLRALGATVYVHANLLRQNLDDLAALEVLVRDRWQLPLSVLPLRAKAANLPFGELMPRYAEIVRRVGVQCLVAFPLCVAAQVQDPALPSGELLSDVMKVYVLDQPFVKPPRCTGCSLRARCAGTFQAYLDLHGDGELVPR